jgi:hypothetical protein
MIVPVPKSARVWRAPNTVKTFNVNKLIWSAFAFQIIELYTFPSSVDRTHLERMEDSGTERDPLFHVWEKQWTVYRTYVAKLIGFVQLGTML